MLGHLELTVKFASFGSLDHNIAEDILQRRVQTISHLRNLQLMTLAKIVKFFSNLRARYTSYVLNNPNHHLLPPYSFYRK